MPGDIKIKYGSQNAFTVTNLHSLAASQTLIAGWGSASVDNTSVLARDYQYGGQFTAHASNRQTGPLTVYVVGCASETPLWPTVSSGTPGSEGLLVFADTYRRAAACKPLFSIDLDSAASVVAVMPMIGIAALFNGYVPKHHFLFVANAWATTTSAGLHTSGNSLFGQPILDQYT